MLQQDEPDSKQQKATNFDNSEIEAIDIKIATMIIENPSVTDQQIADAAGYSRQTINKRRNGESVRRMLGSIICISETEVRRITAKALNRVEKLLDDNDPRVRLAASALLLKLLPELISNERDEKDFKIAGKI